MTTIALVLAAAGAIVFVLAAVTTRALTRGVPRMLDLWVAAGLVRLSEETTWSRIAGAMAVIAVRKLVVAAVDGAAVRGRG